MQRFWKIKKGGKRSFINWNEHRETKDERIGTKTVLRVKMPLFLILTAYCVERLLVILRGYHKEMLLAQERRVFSHHFKRAPKKIFFPLPRQFFSVQYAFDALSMQIDFCPIVGKTNARQ